MTKSNAVVHAHRHSIRLGARVLIAVLVLMGILMLIGVGGVRRDAASLLQSGSLLELLGVSGGVIVVVLALVGVYSVMVDFVFWEGWMQSFPDASGLFVGNEEKRSVHRHFLVYLDGIHQSEESHPPRVQEFLNCLESEIANDSLLVKGIEAYTITDVGLRAASYSRWFWQRLFALQEHHANAFVQFVCAFCIQANNVIKVGISSDRRYGPVMNYELALKIARRLEQLDFHPSHAFRVVLVGYSGGAEMAIGTAEILQKLCFSPVQVITVCGVFSGNAALESIQDVAMVVGSKDPVAAFGRLAYPGRLSLLPLTNWNRWQRSHSLHRYQIDRMSHNGSSGPFSVAFRHKVVAAICRELERSLVSAPSG